MKEYMRDYAINEDGSVNTESYRVIVIEGETEESLREQKNALVAGQMTEGQFSATDESDYNEQLARDAGAAPELPAEAQV